MNTKEDNYKNVVGGYPCLYVGPCTPRCTCVNPLYSDGCYRCASCGSYEQRAWQAEQLADIIDKEYNIGDYKYE